jgi:hypothetical protein
MQQKAQLDQQAMQNKAQIETVQAQADIATQDRKTQAEALSGATGVLATIILNDPAFGAAALGVLTLAGTPLENNASAGGTAAKAEFRDSNDVTIVSGLTVGTSGSDIIITSTTVVSGQPVRVTAAALTHG